MDQENDVPDEESLSRIVFGELAVPADTEDIGDEWVTTPGGEYRLLKFPATYSNPQPGDDGQLVAQEVRLVGWQARNGQIEYSVLVDVTAVLMPNEAALVAAGITAAVEAAERRNNAE